MNIETVINRLKNTIFRKPIDKRLFFLHVPKCGGTSIDKAIIQSYKNLDLRKDRILVRHDSQLSAKVGNILYDLDYTYGSVNDYPVLRFREEHLTYLMLDEQIKYISGHFTFSERIFKYFKNHFSFITIVRNPVDKWLSNYFYRKYRKSDHWMIEDSICDYLKTERGEYHGYDYAKYFGGTRRDGNYKSREAIQNAKDNIEKFDVIGCLEDINDFINKFEEKYNTRLVIEKKNVSKKNMDEVTEDVLEEIKMVCQPDMEIYEYILNNYINNYRDVVYNEND